MEEAAELSNYLPSPSKTRSEQDYIAFLWDAFETNYTHGKYQFAVLAFHMLTMGLIDSARDARELLGARHGTDHVSGVAQQPVAADGAPRRRRIGEFALLTVPCAYIQCMYD